MTIKKLLLNRKKHESKSFAFLLLCLSFILIMMSCGQATNNSNNSFVYENDEYYEFFNPGTPIYITMNFKSESLHNLSEFGGSNADSTKHDFYHPCDLTIKAGDKTYTYENVGAREKGNTSRRFIFDGEWLTAII